MVILEPEEIFFSVDPRSLEEGWSLQAPVLGSSFAKDAPTKLIFSKNTSASGEPLVSIEVEQEESKGEVKERGDEFEGGANVCGGSMP